MKQIDLSDSRTTAQQVLEWSDPELESYRLFAIAIDDALVCVERRRDHAGKWARGQLKPALATVNAALAGIPSIEAERESYRAHLGRLAEASAKVEAASDVDSLVRAKAGLELAERATRSAHSKFVAAARGSALRGVESMPLYFGWTRHNSEGANAQLAGRGPELAMYEIGISNHAHERICFEGRDECTDKMAWEIAGEAEYAAWPGAKAVFELRWYIFAKRNGLPWNEIEDTADEAAAE